jgi:hypothetical protein
MSRSEVYILCEGYHDRAFWAGWLDRLGCKNLGRGCVDPWGKSVTGGQFGFQSHAERFVRVVAAGGKDEVRRLARIRLQERATEPLKAVVASVDHDGFDNANVAEGPLNRESLASLANEIDAEAERVADNHFRIDGGSVDIAVVRWQSDGTHGESVPRQQTLERLCCSAILDAYGDRADPVRAWLASRPGEAPEAGPKAFVWSHMAGWYAEHGCDDFYQELWREPQVAEALENRLRDAGAWQTVESLLR